MKQHLRQIVLRLLCALLCFTIPASAVQLTDKTIPQYVEVPPNIEANQIVSYFSTVLFINSIPCYYSIIQNVCLFPVVGSPLANTLYFILLISNC